MATNVGVLKATLGLDTAGFSAGIGKAKTEISGLKNTASAAERDLRSAAGANANLVSQFNDIGVMLAAGQNPLQLALQQGTQISQVLTQMGGGVGALRALGSAFVGMLNPISLATIGVIGFGAAAVQWLMPAKDEAKKTKDAFESLKESMSTYNDALSVSLLYTGEAEKKFGAEAQRGAEIARRIMVIEAEKTRSSISSILSKAYSDMGFDAFGDRGIDAAGRIASANLAEAASKLGFKSSWSDTLFGIGGISQEKLALAERLGNTMRDIYTYVSQPVPPGGMDDYLTALRQHLDDYTDQLNALKDAGADEEALNAINEKMIPLQRALLEGEAKRAEIRAADEAKANELLATMESQLHMNQLIAEHGKDSLEVRQAELDAEYDKRAAAIEALNVTDEQKDALYDVLADLHDSESQTLAWAHAMAQVNAELQGAYSVISTIGGGMIQRAGIRAASAVLDAGGSAIEAEKARRRAEQRQQFLNDANTADGYRSPEMIDAELAEMERQWAALDEYEMRVNAARERDRAARKKPRKGRGDADKRNRLNGFERSVADIQSQTEAYLRQADAIAKVVAAGGDWEHALAVIEEEQKLLNAAQKAGVAITPDLTQKIRDMAEAHVTAEKTLERMRSATEKGQDAFRNLFGGVLDGADAAREAVANLAMEIAKVQFTKGAMGLLGSTSWGSGMISTIGGLLSFDGGGDTSSGPRAGGLDGKGGFLAMLHPQETVIDHTKGQVAGGATNVHVTVGIDQSGNLYVREIAQQEAARMGQAVSASIPARIQQYQAQPRRRQ